MAAVASRAILAAVFVVGAMAGNAGARSSDILFGFDPVAGGAVQADMRAGQRKIGLDIMVERPIGPARRIVTPFTSAAERPTVRVILAVAGDAVDGRGLEFLRQVTGGAGDGLVFSEQRERRQVVVEAHFFLPRSFTMAGRASVALRSLVRIVRPVTINAIEARKRFGDRFDMAGRAFDRFVRAAQREPRLRMVEAHTLP